MPLLHSLNPLVQTVGVQIHRVIDRCQQLICCIQGMETFVGKSNTMRKRLQVKVKLQM